MEPKPLKKRCKSVWCQNCKIPISIEYYEIGDIKSAVEWLKQECNKIVWDIAIIEGGSNLHYNDLINEKIDESFEDITKTSHKED